MTVVDTRGGRPARRGAAPVPLRGPAPAPGPGVDGPPRADAARTGRITAPVAAAIAFGTGLVGVTVGAVGTNPTGLPTYLGLVAAALVSTLLAARRSLRWLVLTLPLVLFGLILVAAAVEVDQRGSALGAKSVLLTGVEVVTLHAPWLWGATAVGLVVAVARGMLRRPGRG